MFASSSFGVDDCIIRLKAAVAAGADVAFFEAARTKEDVIKVVQALHPTPVLLNLVQGGSTPDFTKLEMEEMGVKLGVSLFSTVNAELSPLTAGLDLQIYPTVGMMTALEACMGAYKHLQETGTYGKAPMSIRSFFATLGLEDSLSITRRQVVRLIQMAFSLDMQQATRARLGKISTVLPNSGVLLVIRSHNHNKHLKPHKYRTVTPNITFYHDLLPSC